MADALIALRRQRGNVKAKITNLDTHLAKLKDDGGDLTRIELLDLQSRVDKANDAYKEFYKIQDKISIDHPDDYDATEITESPRFETAFHKCIAEANDYLIKSNAGIGTVQMPAANVSGNSQQNSSVSLPKIKVPVFSGEYESWIEFKSVFESLIHSSAALSNVVKFHHLRSALEGGDAAQVIKAFAITDASYADAWNLLCERYDNNKLLLHNHITALFTLKPINKESSAELRALINNMSRHLSALEQLKQPVQHWDSILIHFVISKIDVNTTKEWEVKYPDSHQATYAELISFLRERANVLETIESKRAERSNAQSTSANSQTNNNNKVRYPPAFHRPRSPPATRCLVTTDGTEIRCGACKEAHYTSNCPDLLKLSVGERISRVKSLRLCLNCLRDGHSRYRCPARSCQKCGSRHNTILHIRREFEHEQDAKQAAIGDANSHSADQTVALHTTVSINAQVLLTTALVHVHGVDGKTYTARALLDVASQSHFITEEFAKSIGLTVESISIRINGINELTTSVKGRVNAQISSRVGTYRERLDFLVLPRIAVVHPPAISSRFSLPGNLELADPNFYNAGPIDMLLGSDIFWALLLEGHIALGKNKPIMQNTRLGWVLGGRVLSNPRRTETMMQCHFVSLEEQLQKFWTVEECQNQDIQFRTHEERSCEELFLDTVKRDGTGRFIVALPLKGDVEKLGNSYDVAVRMLNAMERRFKRNSALFNDYSNFMKEYEALGHMSRVEPKKNNGTCFYLPHHAVMNLNSVTTKLRVVFNGSARTTTGISLNDVLMVGPLVQENLFAILVRFGSYRVAVISDVAKMYRQILITEKQRDLQRIVWRSHPADEIREYQLNTITYGTKPASFLAIRCIKMLVDSHMHVHKSNGASRAVCRRLGRDMYVDDFISGADSPDEALQLCNGAYDLLASGGFILRKWNSSDKFVLENLKCVPGQIYEFGADDELTRTLGLLWSPENDHFLFRINGSTSDIASITKRKILSDAAQTFDPLGFLAPCTIQAKMFLQELWLLKSDWDQIVHIDLAKRWCEYRNSLIKLNALRISRFYLQSAGLPERVEIHGFCDASEKAYGACLFVRIVTDINITCKLICSKTKVAPLKPLTVPRLELSAALLLSRLLKSYLAAIEFTVNASYMWTDSSIVLGWLRQPAHHMHTFVKNRVGEIHELSQGCSWRHVLTHENPADLLSRGVKAESLLDNALWWNGPPWLSNTEAMWPISQFKEVALPELKPLNNTLLATAFEPCIRIDDYSDLSKIERVMAYVLRFIHNTRVRRDQRRTSFSVSDMNEANLALVRIIQQLYYNDEITKLKESKIITKQSSIFRLKPILQDGVLRVGGRLEYAPISYDKKYPILLPARAHFTRILFRREHLRLLHANALMLVNSIRDKYWIINARRLASKTVRTCIKCFEAKPRVVTPMMGNLPKCRVNPTFAFAQCAVDYAGPFMLRASSIRNAKSYKAYVSVFICMVTTAVHLEIVTSLSSDSFMATLRRFAARRGRPAELYSDNGTNFVGACNKLRELYEFLESIGDNIQNFATAEGIKWHFAPPRAPHFNGLCEAAVKRMKYHLSRVIGERLLTYEDFSTVLCQVEAIMNSRPLSPLSNDPHDLDPLSPAHFLVGRKLTTIADYDYVQIPDSRLSNFQRVSSMVQGFWKRWAREYLGECLKRSKWRINQPTALPKVGDLALIQPESEPYRWQLGRITQLHPGTDGVARVATLRTSRGDVKRALIKIAPLPFEDDDCGGNEPPFLGENEDTPTEDVVYPTTT